MQTIRFGLLGFSTDVIIELSRGGEMADALALGASAARHGGSTPLPGTTSELTLKARQCKSRAFTLAELYVILPLASQTAWLGLLS